MNTSTASYERSPREGLQINTCASTSESSRSLSHETHTTASPTSTSPTRHHSRSTTLTPREQLPPTLKMSMYTADFLAAFGGDGFEKGIGVIWEMKVAPGRRQRGALGDVFVAAGGAPRLHLHHHHHQELRN